MDMEWAFAVEGNIGSAALMEQLRSIEGMVNADVDVQTNRILLAFDADKLCGGEILGVLRACGCSASKPLVLGGADAVQL